MIRHLFQCIKSWNKCFYTTKSRFQQHVLTVRLFPLTGAKSLFLHVFFLSLQTQHSHMKKDECTIQAFRHAWYPSLKDRVTWAAFRLNTNKAAPHATERAQGKTKPLLKIFFIIILKIVKKTFSLNVWLVECITCNVEIWDMIALYDLLLI